MQQQLRFKNYLHFRQRLAVAIILLLVAAGMSLSALSIAEATTPANLLEIPGKYDKVICRINADSPRQRQLHDWRQTHGRR